MYVFENPNYPWSPSERRVFDFYNMICYNIITWTTRQNHFRHFRKVLEKVVHTLPPRYTNSLIFARSKEQICKDIVHQFLKLMLINDLVRIVKNYEQKCSDQDQNK